MTFTSKSFPTRSARSHRGFGEQPCGVDEFVEADAEAEIHDSDALYDAMLNCKRCHGGPCLNEPEAA